MPVIPRPEMLFGGQMLVISWSHIVWGSVTGQTECDGPALERCC